MADEITFHCDRCKQKVTGYQDAYFTMGFYNVSPDGAWYRFSRVGEQRICDHCMWSDPDYIKIYGARDAVASEWLEGQQ